MTINECEKVLSSIKNDKLNIRHKSTGYGIVEIAEWLINELKAVDVQPIKHGRWITKAENYYKAWQDSGRSWDDMPYFVTGKHIACSECFTEYDVCTEGIEHWTGCPCCLTRMDGDTD